MPVPASPSSSRAADAARTRPGPSARPTASPIGITPEVLRQVKLIELRTRRLVNSLFSGEYRSIFKGQGMEFAEVREYQPGDEVRSIDWNVTARMRRPFVKRYIEERELTLMLVVDLSGSGQFGTVNRFKVELATELAAVLTMSAVRNNDRVGTLLFTDRVEHFVPPGKGRRHALRILRDIFVHRPTGTGTNIGAALDHLRKMLSQHAIIFLITDLDDPAIERPLKLLNQRHDVVVARVEDPAEHELPDVGLATLRDPETGALVAVDTSHPKVRVAYAGMMAERRAAKRALLRRLAIDEIPVTTQDSFIEPLMRFFRARERRVARG
ncbi:MAG: DUF58 domain-containing protein [Gemmatimonadetes bacterium]|nr:DUF58 domain-containing protein [Gemmatimonadota bacterium]